MLCSLLPIAFVAAATAPVPRPMTVTEIVDRIVRADNERLAAFAGYTGMRRYRFQNAEFGKHAEMTVRVVCAGTGAKTFEVLEESGSGFIRRKVIQKMIDAEREASEKGEREKTRIIPENYSFRLVGADLAGERPAYILEITPRTDNKFLVRGRIWVDAEEFAIARVEGSPARSVSFWVRSVHIVHQYKRFGKLWLPVTNESLAKVRIFGATEVKIEYFDYMVNQARPGSARSLEPMRVRRALVKSGPVRCGDVFDVSEAFAPGRHGPDLRYEALLCGHPLRNVRAFQGSCLAGEDQKR